jgi:ribosomal protein S11
MVKNKEIKYEIGNLYITTTKRNTLIVISKNQKVIVKTTMGLLNIKKQDMRSNYAIIKLAYTLSFLLKKSQIKYLNIYINSDNRKIKYLINQIFKTNFSFYVIKISNIKNYAHNGTKIRNARRK